ncbi:nuclease SbcCD subunit C [Spirochaetia bacterium]|nr:nuclease SbcCD subunit C [Spirochaetia bacterium]
MRPEKLTLENFGPFVGQEIIDFCGLSEIFLITGKTGSGKTTIFDAICYALYGDVPGDRGTNRIHSDYAKPATDCSVSLEFSLGTKRYRVDRSLRSNKNLKFEEEATLYEIINTFPANPSGKKNEANKKIKELIGLDKEQFCKVVLLPQGEFAKFLKENSKARKPLLSKLFSMEKIDVVTDYAVKQTKELKEKRDEIERSLNSLKDQGISAENHEKLHAEKSSAVTVANEHLQSLNETVIYLQKVVDVLNEKEQCLKALSEVQSRISRHENNADSIHEKENRLDRARQAELLRPHLERVEQDHHDADHAAEKSAAATAHSENVRQKQSEMDFQSSTIHNQEKMLQDRRLQMQWIQELAKKEQQLRSSQQDLDKQFAKNEYLKVELHNFEKSIQNLDDKIRNYESQSAQMETLQIEREQAQAEERRRTEIVKMVQLHDNAVREYVQVQRDQEEIAQRLPGLRSEVTRLAQEQRMNYAAHLASQLKKGEPCPVCGSKNHPACAEGAALGFESEKSLQDLQDAYNAAERQWTVAETQRAAKDHEINRLLEEYHTVNPDHPMPSPADAGTMLEQQHAAVHSLDKQYTAILDSNRQLTAYRPKRNRAEDQRREKERTLEREGEKYRNLQTTVESMRQEQEQFRNEWGKSPAAVHAEWEREIPKWESAITAYKESREKMIKEQAEAESNRANAESNRIDAENKYQKSRSGLEQLLVHSAFTDIDALKNALLNADFAVQLEHEITGWKDQKIRLDSELREKEQQFEKIQMNLRTFNVEPDLNREKAGARLQSFRKEQDKATQNLIETRTDLNAFEQKTAEFNRLNSLFQESEAEYLLQKRFSDDISGTNHQKKPFNMWLLGRYFEEVTIRASKYFDRMSEGRYRLRLDLDYKSGNAFTGLDLEVCDSHTGQSRPCSTLSGGESFLASISLALGLADSIQARSGAVRLDAVFIDEGFGSLDEATLDLAFNILDEIREHRMVGLISHVSEMRSRIPSQIEIKKSNSGSRVIIR